MKRVPISLASLLSSALLLGGCSKSDAPEMTAESGAAPAAEEVPAVPAATATEESQPGPVAETPTPELPPVAVGPVGMPAMERFAGEEKAFQEWCRRYQFDANDPAMLDADTDGDGVSNREEFVGDSDPRDAGSRPGVLATMRLKSFQEVRLPVVLDQVKGDRAFLKQIEGGEEKDAVVKAGDVVRGMKVGRVVTRRETDKTGQPTDVSRVTLEDVTTKERVTLVKGLPARTAATHAVVVSPDGATSITVRQGETFEWPGVGSEPGMHYTVVDMSDDHVVVQQVENQKMWTIPRK